MTLNAIEGKPLPVYGDGSNVRDWLYVEDHCLAVRRVLEAGQVGQTYNIGGRCEKTNLEIVRLLCRTVQEHVPGIEHRCQDLVTFVPDRPGHDHRYAIDSSKIEKELGWRPQVSFEQGLLRTVQWYIQNREWIERVQSGRYRRERLGLGEHR
jgi:dTDP-glucose 4,6-dehydratase